ncbi:MAG: hypothetical protein KBD39_09800 [Sterolibacterium sp.]|nr:hypothetical protein [Sterolibacterium sp.]MBP9800396.1 hypothetical protein [Sterolibacterium sp.]
MLIIMDMASGARIDEDGTTATESKSESESESVSCPTHPYLAPECRPALQEMVAQVTEPARTPLQVPFASFTPPARRRATTAALRQTRRH